MHLLPQRRVIAVGGAGHAAERGEMAEHARRILAQGHAEVGHLRVEGRCEGIGVLHA